MDAKVTILYDSVAEADGFETGWGFSAFIEVKSSGARVLFDTGWDGEALLKNMKTLGINPKEIDLIVISHNHWDHIGGLPSILKSVGDDARVLLPPSVSRRFRDEVRRWREAEIVEAPGEVKPFGVFTTGGLSSDVIEEQSLVVPLPGKGGNLVVVGCSHPGLDRIVEAAGRFGGVFGILGGMHSFREFEKLQGVHLFAPLHCTRYRDELEALYPGRVSVKGVGGVYFFE